MPEIFKNKIEENPSIINDITSGKCEIKFVSKKSIDDPEHDGYRSEVVELNLIYPSPIGENNKLNGSIFIYYPQKNFKTYKREPEMRLEIKWHKGTLILGDGKNEGYLSLVLDEISKQDRESRSNDFKQN
jgi:hypothetical protein